MSGTQTLTYTGTITRFTAPATGLYDIIATSASGGDGVPGPSGPASGGHGVTVGGEFMLTQNETLQIVAGGAGETGTFSGETGGGGGGSFVIGPGNTPLLIAGGGGGGSSSGDRGFDGGGITTSGGGGGSGGQIITNSGGAGGGGGGLSADGSAGPSATLTGSPPLLLPGGAGGQAFVNGAAGGAGGLPGSDGGFGGGGGGGVGGGGGGGGGYTGGNGGDGFITINSGFGFPANDSGGGGTSFDAGTNQTFSVDTGVGNGVIMITPPPPTITPETPSVVEVNQNTDIATVAPGGAGDLLTLTQTGGSGALSLGPVQADGTQQVIYTAPALVPASTTDAVSYQISEPQDGAAAFGSASVQLDSGPTITAVTPSVLEQGRSTAIGAVTPGLPGDTLTLTQTSPTANGTVSLQNVTGVEEVIYTAPAVILQDKTVQVSYQISDQHADATRVGVTSVQLQAKPLLITPETPSVVESLQTTDIATVAPGVAGDTLTVQTLGLGSASLGPVQADGTQQVIYTAPALIPESVIDRFNYEVVEQQAGETASAISLVQLDSGPTITAVTPSVLEQGQTTEIGTVTPGLPGDTLILTQTSPTANGTVSLQHPRFGDAEVFYTAPASITASTMVPASYQISDQHADASASGKASVQLDAGPTITAVAASSVQNGQSTEIATVIPGLPSDTLILQQTSPPPGRIPSVFLQLVHGVYEVFYTAPGNFNSSPTQKLTYSVIDQHNDVVAIGTAFVGGNTNQSVTANGDTSVILGGGNDTVALSGTSNAVFLGNGNDKVTVSGGGNTISLGSGNDTVAVSGGGNTISFGTGNDTVAVSGGGNTISLGSGNDIVALNGTSNAVFLGNGNDKVTVSGGGNTISLGSGNDTVEGGTGDTIQLAGNGNLTVSGKSELVFLGGGNDTVTDTGQGLKLNIGPVAGNDSLVNFASDLSSGIIDLLGGIGGYTSASQAYAALKNDGHGGALLRFGHASSLDIVGVKTSQLSANNIHIG